MEPIKSYHNFGSITSLPNDKNVDWSKLKRFADDNLNIAQMMEFSFDRVENIVGKGENAGFQHFLLFTQCFPKASICKIPDCGANS